MPQHVRQSILAQAPVLASPRYISELVDVNVKLRRLVSEPSRRCEASCLSVVVVRSC